MSDNLMSPQEAASIIFPVVVSDIRAELARLLSFPDCAEFVRELLRRASADADAGNTLIADGDILQVFDIVQTQGGIIRAGAPGSIPGANFASGSIGGGNARIQIGNVRPGLPVTFDDLKKLYRKSDGRFVLHETIHLTGRFVYSDMALADAVSTMPGVQEPLPTNGDRFAFSRYWDRELKRRCH